MQCPRCQAQIEDDSRFCRHCGKPMESAVAAAGTTPAAAARTPGPVVDPIRDPAQEKEIWQGRPSFRAGCGLWAAWAAGAVVLLAVAYRYTAYGSFLRTAAWLLAGASGAAILTRQAMLVLGVFYRLTSQRLFVHRGILTRTTDQIELVRVEDVRLCRGIVDRLVNTGDVEVISSDQTDKNLLMQAIFVPDHVAESIRRNVRLIRSKGTLFVENV